MTTTEERDFQAINPEVGQAVRRLPEPISETENPEVFQAVRRLPAPGGGSGLLTPEAPDFSANPELIGYQQQIAERARRISEYTTVLASLTVGFEGERLPELAEYLVDSLPPDADPNLAELTRIAQEALPKQMFDRAMSGAAGFLRPDIEPIFNAAIDTWIERRGLFITAADVMVAREDGAHIWNDYGVAADAFENKARDLAMENFGYIALDDDLSFEERAAVAAEVEDIADTAKHLAGRDGAWWKEGDNLVLTVKTGDKNVDTYRVLLKPGTEVGSDLEAFMAVAMAIGGKGGHLLDLTESTRDEVPGFRSLRGALWQKIGDAQRILSPASTRGWERDLADQLARDLSVDDADYLASQLLDRQASKIQNSDIGQIYLAQNPQWEAIMQAEQSGARHKLTEQMLQGTDLDKMVLRRYRAIEATKGAWLPDRVAGVMLSNIADPADQNTTVTQLAAAADLIPPEMVQAATGNMVGEQVDQVLDSIYEFENDQTAFQNWLNEQVLDPVMTGLEAWEAMIQTFGSNILSPFVGGYRALDEVINDEAGWTELWDLWGDTAQQIRDDSETIADIWDLDGASATWVNMMGSIMLDPITWVTLSPAGATKGMMKTILTPAARKAFRHPRWWNLAHKSVMAEKPAAQASFFNILKSQVRGGPARKAILDIVTSPRPATWKAQRDSVEKILKIVADDTTRGLSRPVPPRRLLLRQQREYLVTALANIDQLAKSDDRMRGVFTLLAQADRSVQIAKHPDYWLDQVEELIHWAFGGTPEETEWLRKAYNLWDDYQSGWQAWRNDLMARVQSLKDERTAITKEYSVGLRSVAGHSSRVRSAENMVSRVKSNLGKAKARNADPEKIAALEENLALAEEVLAARTANRTSKLDDVLINEGYDPDEALAIAEEILERRANIRARISVQGKMRRKTFGPDINETLAGAHQVPDDLLPFEEFTQRIVHDWGVRAGLKPVEGTEARLLINPTTGLPESNLDWRKLKGKSLNLNDRIKDIDPSLAGATEAQLAQELGVSQIGSKINLPASPSDLIILERMGDKGVEKLLSGAKEFRANRLRQALDGLTYTWKVILLINALSGARGGIDEVTRLIEDVGVRKAFGNLKNAKNTVLGAIPAGKQPKNLSGPVRQAVAEATFGTRSVFDPWTVVSRGGKGHREAVERYFNGHLFENEQIREWAAVYVSGGPGSEGWELFEEWFYQKGHLYIAPELTNAAGKRVPATPEVVYENLTKVMQGVVRTADPEHKADFLDFIADLAANGKKIELESADPAIKKLHNTMARWAPDVPGQAFDGDVANWQSAMMKWFWQNPQMRRHQAAFDTYFDEVWQSYLAAEEMENIKILRAQDVIDAGITDDAALAGRMVSQGSREPAIRHLLGPGVYTEDEALAAATRYAEDRAHALAYHISAGSIFGSGLEHIAPFGRAHIDFWQYWMAKFFQPTMLKAPGDIPGLRKFFPNSGGGVTPMLAPRAATKRAVPLVPFNARMVSRIRSYTTAVNQDSEEVQSRINPASPAFIFSSATFLPTRFDAKSLMADIVFSLGPEATSILHGLDAADWLDIDTVADWLPSLEWQLDEADGLIERILETWVPERGRSLRSQVGHLASWLFANAPREFQNIAAGLLDWDRYPPGALDLALYDSALWWENNYTGGLETAGTDPSEDRSAAEGHAILEIGRSKAMSAAGGRFGKAYFGAGAVGGGDREYTRYIAKYLPTLMGYLHDQGSFPDSVKDEWGDVLEAAKDLVDDPAANDLPALLALADVTRSVLLNLEIEDLDRALVLNNGIGSLIVPTFQAKENSDGSLNIPDEFQKFVKADGRLVFPFTSEGRAMRNQAFDNDNIENRPWNGPDGIWTDIGTRVSQAHRNEIRRLWTWTMGSTLVSEGKTADSFNRPSEDDGKRMLHIPMSWFTGFTGMDERDTLAYLGKLGIDLDRGDFGADNTLDISWGDWFSMTRAARQEHQARTGIENEPFGLKAWSVDMQNIAVSEKAAEVIADYAYDQGWDIFGFTMSEGNLVDLSFFGERLLQDYRDWTTQLEEHFGWDNPRDWRTITGADEFAFEFDDGRKFVITDGEFDPREFFKARIRTALTLNPSFNEGDYQRWMGWAFGDLDWDGFEPPKIWEVGDEQKISLKPNEVNLIDADTVRLHDSEGNPIDFRLIGLNAPEDGEPGWEATLDSMEKAIAEAETVTLAIVDPELFGTTTQHFKLEDGVLVDRERILVLMYVDGVPLFRASEFSAINPQGRRLSGDPFDAAELLSQHRGAYGDFSPEILWAARRDFVPPATDVTGGGV